MPTNKKRKVSPAEPTPDALARAQAGFFNTKIVLQASQQPLQAPVAEESELLVVLKALLKELRDSNQLERLKQKREIEQKDNEDVMAKKAKNEDEERFADLSNTMYS